MGWYRLTRAEWADKPHMGDLVEAESAEAALAETHALMVNFFAGGARNHEVAVPATTSVDLERIAFIEARRRGQ